MIYFYSGAFNPMTFANLKIILDVKKNINDEDWLTIIDIKKKPCYYQAVVKYQR